MKGGKSWLSLLPKRNVTFPLPSYVSQASSIPLVRPPPLHRFFSPSTGFLPHGSQFTGFIHIWPDRPTLSLVTNLLFGNKNTINANVINLLCSSNQSPFSPRTSLPTSCFSLSFSSSLFYFRKCSLYLRDDRSDRYMAVCPRGPCPQPLCHSLLILSTAPLDLSHNIIYLSPCPILPALNTCSPRSHRPIGLAPLHQSCRGQVVMDRTTVNLHQRHPKGRGVVVQEGASPR